jgi:hypothetical protein
MKISNLLTNIRFMQQCRKLEKDYDSLRSNYPSIIIDVISIINSVMNTKGDTVSSISIDKYYQSRKQQAAISTEEDEVPAPIPMPTISSSVLLTLEGNVATTIIIITIIKLHHS